MTQEKWIPETGKLVLRRIVRPGGSEEIELNYREKAEDEAHHMTIAELRHGAAKACCAGHIETLVGQEHHYENVGTFYRRYATDEDLDRIVACWTDKHTSLDEWLAAIRKYDRKLLDSEKTRIEQAVSRSKS